jgi:hypothetical protein
VRTIGFDQDALVSNVLGRFLAVCTYKKTVLWDLELDRVVL